MHHRLRGCVRPPAALLLLLRRTLQDLLRLDPDNRQAADLKAAVEHVLRRDGAIGLALLSTATAAVAAMAVGAAVLKRR